MQKTNKGLYGFLAFGPLAIIVISIVGLVAMVAQLEGRRGSRGDDAEVMLFIFFGLMIVAAILSFVSLIMYIIHIARSPYLNDGARIGWIIGMVFANGITQLIYFFLYVVKEDEHERDRQSRENYQREVFGQSGPGRNPFE